MFGASKSDLRARLGDKIELERRISLKSVERIIEILKNKSLFYFYWKIKISAYIYEKLSIFIEILFIWLVLFLQIMSYLHSIMAFYNFDILFPCYRLGTQMKLLSTLNLNFFINFTFIYSLSFSANGFSKLKIIKLHCIHIINIAI